MEQKALTVKDVPANQFIAAYAEYLKRSNKIDIPPWVDYAKTGKHKQMAPYDRDWLYIRAAALARKVYLRAHLGTGALRKIYGGTMNFGTTPRHFVTGSGKVIRYLLKQLERNGIVAIDEEERVKGKTGGRKITRKGQQELDSIVKQIKA